MIQTSTTSPLDVGWVPLPRTFAGGLGITMAPGRRGGSLTSGTTWLRDLEADLRRLRDVHGARLLVCCMEDKELRLFGLERLFAVAEHVGVETARVPIRDGSTPEMTWALRVALRKLREVVQRDRAVVHCLGGLGRSGLVAGCLLTELGCSAASALDALARARGPRCPETLEQVAFVRRWAEWGPS